MLRLNLTYFVFYLLFTGYRARPRPLPVRPQAGLPRRPVTAQGAQPAPQRQTLLPLRESESTAAIRCDRVLLHACVVLHRGRRWTVFDKTPFYTCVCSFKVTGLLSRTEMVSS